jgi:hypothetical protein
VLQTNNVDRWYVSPTGHLISPTDNTYDIGASGTFRPRSIYAGSNGTFGGTLTVGGDLTTGSTLFAVDGDFAGNVLVSGDVTSGATVFSVDGEFSGTVMTDLLMASGKISASIPNYANDAAADADVNLLSGQLYRTGGGRAVYQKP